MKALLSSLIVLTSACTRECPKLQSADPCKDPVVTTVADAVAPTTSRVYRETLDFVRLGYGDSHDLYVRSLEFRTECLSTGLMQQALRLVPEYNAFEGAKVADGIEKLRGEIMCWQFGRESSPVLYMQIPYWLSQAEKACPALHDEENAPPCPKPDHDRRLTEAEFADLTNRAKTLFHDLHADEVGFDQIATNTMRVWWD
jgi:hypothetical protein